MRVITHWPALVPAIERAGHTPVLTPPLQYDGTDPVVLKQMDSFTALVCSPGSPPVVVSGETFAPLKVR